MSQQFLHVGRRLSAFRGRFFPFVSLEHRDNPRVRKANLTRLLFHLRPSFFLSLSFSQSPPSLPVIYIGIHFTQRGALSLLFTSLPCASPVEFFTKPRSGLRLQKATLERRSSVPKKSIREARFIFHIVKYLQTLLLVRATLLTRFSPFSKLCHTIATLIRPKNILTRFPTARRQVAPIFVLFSFSTGRRAE